MPINTTLQIPALSTIPFMGSGKLLLKKQLDLGATVIVKDKLNTEYQIKITNAFQGVYTGNIISRKNNKQNSLELNSVVEFNKNNVFLIV